MQIFLGIFFGLLLALGLFIFLLPKLMSMFQDRFAKLSQDALNKNSEQFLTLAKERLATEQLKGVSELEQKKQAVESAIKGLTEHLESYEKLVKGFEKDRDMKYGGLSDQLKNAVEQTDKLHTSTEKLNNILGNVKLRGQWGERIAEDILRFCGFQEGIHYVKNKKQEFQTTRPDYTFFLPGSERKVHMDVKFPLDKYRQLFDTKDDGERKRLQEGFIKDTRDRIKELQTREYINPEEQTLDFVILFIPNEQAYGFIHETSPGLHDEALNQKVILCSPFTLYAVVSVIRQAHDNFYITQAVREIVTKIHGFIKTYGIFKERFKELGERLDKVSEKYSEITETSYRMLEAKIRQIEEYRKGQKIPETLPEFEEEIKIPEKI